MYPPLASLSPRPTTTAKITLILACLFLSSAASSAEQLYTEQATVTPKLAAYGELAVGVRTEQISNPDQLNAADFQSRADRELTVEIWYPAQTTDKAELATYKDVTRSKQAFELQGQAYRDADILQSAEQFPLVVISHGYTDYRSLMFYLAEHLASHGYVVISIDHTDSTNAEVDFDTAPSAGFPSTLLNRARDQQFVLDHFSAQSDTLAGIIDFEKATIMGYSMGGYGAVNTVGGCYDFTAAGLQLFGLPAEMAAALAPIFSSCNAGREEVDLRWKAMVAFAPWGGEPGVHNLESMANITVPSLYIAGDEDDISGYENGVKKLFKHTGSKHKYMMVYENARHNIAKHPAPKVAYGNDLDIGHYFEPAWNSETINRVNEHMVLAFLNCHVKKQDSFCDYLPATEDITQSKSADGPLTKAWPGFKERWGTGIKFYRQ